jgi:4-amino-4-deoxy-L-arabinose transferase-like glycosyltransferase
VVLILFCYVAFFWQLGDYGLWDPDEGRNGVIAKDLLASGNLLTLTREGQPYYDKPALFYWLVALAIKLFGLSEIAVRLPSALAATLTVGSVYAFGRVSRDWRWGLWSAVVLATSFEFVALGRFGNMDMVFTFFFTSALLYFFRWYRDRSGRPIWPFYAFMALAALTKGPVGILLPCLILVVSLAWNRRWAVVREMRLRQGAAIILVVAGPWYLLAAARDPEYIWTFLWKHNFLRFVVSQPGIDHPEPLYYLLVILLGGYLPWILFLPAIGYSRWRDKDETKIFLLVWAVAVVVFFSLSHNKLGTYILPAFPPLALLTGDALRSFMAGSDENPRKQAWIVGASFLWLSLLLFISPLSGLVLGSRYPHYFSSQPPLGPAAILMGLALLATVAGKRKVLPLLVSVSALWLVAWFYKVKAPEVSVIRSARGMAEVVSSNGINDYRVAALKAGSFSYYLSRPVQIVSHPGKIQGLLSEPIPTVALVKDKHLRELAGLPQSSLFVWKRVHSGNALIANFPRPDA